ncbi:MAG: HAD family hydrolase [Acidimicrobiales bacterium]|jgi:putative hydrolase of the HAD superfamily
MSSIAGPITTVGIDADDTLWHCEPHFKIVEGRFADLIAAHGDPEEVDAHLLEVERANLEIFGYGVKGFVLSMIETAIQLTDGAVPGDDIATIIGWGREMMTEPIELMPGVAQTIELLARDYDLVVMTKGDLFHQESKVASSGLAEHLTGVEVFHEKDEATYAKVLAKRQINIDEFVMVGNSMSSDVQPVLAVGGRAIHIPYETNWALDHAEGDGHGYTEIERFDLLPNTLREMTS